MPLRHTCTKTSKISVGQSCAVISYAMAARDPQAFVPTSFCKCPSLYLKAIPSPGIDNLVFNCLKLIEICSAATPSIQKGTRGLTPSLHVRELLNSLLR